MRQYVRLADGAQNFRRIGCDSTKVPRNFTPEIEDNICSREEIENGESARQCFGISAV